MPCDQKRCSDWEKCANYLKIGSKDLCSRLEEEHHMNKDLKMVEGQVDVIIPAYDCSEFIESAIESVLSQTYPAEKITITVVDDGSSDGTSEVVKALQQKNPQITLISKRVNGGANAARNSALKVTNGEYVYIMDADSVLAEDILEKLVSKLSKFPKFVGYAYCGFNRLWETESGGRLDVWPSGQFDAASLKQNNYISMMSLIRRECMPEGGMDEKIERFQDWDLWLTMLESGIIGVWVDETLFLAHIREKGISKDQTKIPVYVQAIMQKHKL